MEEEPDKDKALRVLDQVHEQPAEFAVPDFFFIEMMSVLARLVPTADELKNYVQCLYDLGLIQVRTGGKLLCGAADIALRFGVLGYDAAYLAAAESLDAPWLTAHAKAHQRVYRLKQSALL